MNAFDAQPTEELNHLLALDDGGNMAHGLRNAFLIMLPFYGLAIAAIAHFFG